MENNNRRKADDFIDEIEDPVVRRITGYFLQQVFVTLAQGRALAEGEFDLHFYAVVVANAVQHPEVLQSLLNGEDLSWDWPEHS